MHHVLAFLFLVVASAAIACRAPASEPAIPVGTWTVVELDGAELGGLERRPELVIAADGAVSGFGGVNRFSGRFEPDALAEGRIVAGPLAATRMAGPEDAMRAEVRLFQLLTEPLAWTRSRDELVLELRGAVVVRLIRAV